MICIAMQGHDYDDDFYEIIRKFFPEESIKFIDTLDEGERGCIIFSSTYQEPVVDTKIFFPGYREVFHNTVTLDDAQVEDENIIRYEIIKSLILGLNSLEI
ncbi:MAG: hypothetical protein Q4Q07_00865 [Tissierellia bacterium]|nr:hypothetical protein [Tissierellia bacterium]